MFTWLRNLGNWIIGAPAPVTRKQILARKTCCQGSSHHSKTSSSTVVPVGIPVDPVADLLTDPILSPLSPLSPFSIWDEFQTIDPVRDTPISEPTTEPVVETSAETPASEPTYETPAYEAPAPVYESPTPAYESPSYDSSGGFSGGDSGGSSD